MYLFIYLHVLANGAPRPTPAPATMTSMCIHGMDHSTRYVAQQLFWTEIARMSGGTSSLSVPCSWPAKL